ncbi:hypothetical protein GOP47_0022828 [Adiantum capillus-veneris]|uniref:Cellulose synthase-like protein D3 n=1 Tax=Adiantum capillus-veneris TaxID=13818 RepID=A0A9D4Z5P9_ADICA|nr:hypothetical protein GOP47_0022828 [Adiantum capillus-veneris]
MSSPSLPSILSRSMGRSFRNPTKADHGLLIPKCPSATGSYLSNRTNYASHYEPIFNLKDELCGSPPLPTEKSISVCIACGPDNHTMLHGRQSNHGGPGAVITGIKAPGQDEHRAIFNDSFESMEDRPIIFDTKECDSQPNSQQERASSHFCSVDGCDSRVMHNEQGTLIFPCECKYPICCDCYMDHLKEGGTCPGCREEYKGIDDSESLPFPLPAGPLEPCMDRTLSLIKSTRTEMVLSTKKLEFDYARWLYETKGTYGYGNAFKTRYTEEEGFGSMCEDFTEKSSRPLAREKKICTAIISPYRLMVLIRVISLFFFLAWRIRNPNRKAMWLWGMSVICEIWFAFSWILNQLPKLMPINRSTDLEALKDRFERPSPSNPAGRSDLPGIDIFVTTADPSKEPPLVTANSILSILAVDYPVEKVACYLSDDCGSLLTFEALAEVASYSRVWVPFCRKHNIEPRNPENYFNSKGDATKNKVRKDFVKDRRRIKREYDEFKVRINSLPDVIRRRSDACNAQEETKAKRAQIERGAYLLEKLEVPKATWMADGSHWPGGWDTPVNDHCRGDHAGIIQVMLRPPSAQPLAGESENIFMDLTGVDTRLPMLVYVSREKRPGYDHNKKAGAMNSLTRVSAILSNAPFILNLDCDHYIHNSQALRAGMCFMLGIGGENICYVQFPQRFENIDPSDRYANHNTVFFDGGMRALDGVQGPIYVGTGCIFRRTALYGFHPPLAQDHHGGWCNLCSDCQMPSTIDETEFEIMEAQLLISKNFGASEVFFASIPTAEIQGRPLTAGNRYGRPAGMLMAEQRVLSTALVAEAISVISCWYEDKTDWGSSIGWIYGSVTEDVVTGYHMHNRGWRSVYCVIKPDAFRGTAPLNLTDRLHQVLRWATGSVEIFFSRSNSLLAGSRMKLLQRIAYLNIAMSPFTSLFLLVYCFLPALSLFSNEFIVETLNAIFLVYLLVMTMTLCLIALLEVRWSGITLEEWWRNEQFWIIKGTSADLVAVLHGLLKVVTGIDISFTLTSKPNSDHATDEFEDLYIIKWTCLIIPPLTIMIVNLISIAVAVARTVYSSKPDWTKLLGGTFFSIWVLLHLYPFAKGFTGRRGRTPTIIWVWASLLALTISLLWVAIISQNTSFNTGFQL